VTTIAIMPRRLLALAIGLVVLVFGGSAAVCATMPSWPSPAMFVLATVALPFLALGALLVAGAPVGFPLLLVWLFDRALCAWAQQSQARQAAADVLAARLDALERRR
jgi:hypothetical protein